MNLEYITKERMMSEIIDNIREVLVDIDNWLDIAKVNLERYTENLEELRNINDADTEDEVRRAIGKLRVDRARFLQENFEYLKKIRDKNLQKYEEYYNFLDEYTDKLARNLICLSRMQNKEEYINDKDEIEEKN